MEAHKRLPFIDVYAVYENTRGLRTLDLRTHGVPDVPVLAWCGYGCARIDLPVHRHIGVMEIHLVQRGKQVFHIGEKRYHVRGGEMLIMFPGETHRSGGQFMGANVLFCLQLKLPTRGRPLLQLSKKESDLLVQGLNGLPQRHFRATAKAKTLFNRLFALHDQQELPLRTIRMRLAVLELLVEVIDSASKHTDSETSRRIQAVVQEIEKRPQTTFCLKDLARQAHLSLSRFKSRFKAETGVPPKQFILQCKIEAARNRLADGRESVSKIAIDMGFSSSQHFATVFKRLLGESPTTCRNRRGSTARRRPKPPQK
jgi:AraC-like DNA-binding protein